MEPSLIKNNKGISKQTKILLIIVILALSIFIGTSYSILTSSDETEEVIMFQAGDLNLEVKTNTDNTVNLKDELPKGEEEVENPIILNIKNTGSLTICEYRLKLIADTEETTPTSDLPTSYIRYAVSLDNGASYRGSKLLSETNNQIYIGLDLKPEATKTIYVKVWLDETALDNEEVLNKHFYGKIDAELLQRCETPATEIVKATIGETGGIIGVTNDNQKVITDGENIREYRYSGLGVNNYVRFNNETWRILGIFKDEEGQEHVKIVRNETLTTQMPETYIVEGTTYTIKLRGNNGSWNSTPTSEKYSDWTTAGLMYWLNSKGTTNGYLKILTNESQNMIYETTYYLGNVYHNGTAAQSYEDERKSTECSSNIVAGSYDNKCYIWSNNQTTWKGSIALMYQSDYQFSLDSIYWNTKLGYDKDVSIKEVDTSWLFKDANHMYLEWFLSPSSGTFYSITVWVEDGSVYAVNSQDSRAVRPALYLKSEVTITSGDGSIDNPYQLNI